MNRWIFPDIRLSLTVEDPYVQNCPYVTCKCFLFSFSSTFSLFHRFLNIPACTVNLSLWLYIHRQLVLSWKKFFIPHTLSTLHRSSHLLSYTFISTAFKGSLSCNKCPYTPFINISPHYATAGGHTLLL